MIDSYFIHLLTLIGIYLILGISLQLSVGYAGLLNFGHVAFFGIGAYVAAILALNDLPFFFYILAASFTAAFSGWLLSIPTNKLKGDYLALVTLGFSFVIYALLLNLTGITRGPLGLPGIPRPTILGIAFIDNYSYLILVYICVLFSYFLISRIVHSPLGQATEATRDDELSARSLGKNTFKLKSLNLTISAFFAGLAGSLFALYITFIDPSSFTLTALIPILSIIIIGGLASLPGTIFATFIIVLLPEPLRFLNFPSSIMGPTRQIVYVLILLLIIYYLPRGFYGKIDLDKCLK
jgi:branched-chain amino acid transport system permease protein